MEMISKINTDIQVTDGQVTDIQVTDIQVTDIQVTDGQVTDIQVTDGQVTDIQVTAHITSASDVQESLVTFFSSASENLKKYKYFE